MPSSDLARSRPSLASGLNERSLRPPMSVTRPTLIFLAPGVDSELLDPLLEESSSPPQPTATRPQRQSVKITNRCTARRIGTSLPSKGKVMGPAKSGGSLQVLPVVRRIYDGEKRTSETLICERALQRDTRHLSQ